MELLRWIVTVFAILCVFAILVGFFRLVFLFAPSGPIDRLRLAVEESNNKVELAVAEIASRLESNSESIEALREQRRDPAGGFRYGSGKEGA